MECDRSITAFDGSGGEIHQDPMLVQMQLDTCGGAASDGSLCNSCLCDGVAALRTIRRILTTLVDKAMYDAGAALRTTRSFPTTRVDKSMCDAGAAR
jgi:hypothetical protein